MKKLLTLTVLMLAWCTLASSEERVDERMATAIVRVNSPRGPASLTGVYVGQDTLVTNAHGWEDGCSITVFAPRGVSGTARVLLKSAEHDVMVLSGPPNLSWVPLSETPVKQGDVVFMSGYPLFKTKAEGGHTVVLTAAYTDGSFELLRTALSGHSGSPVTRARDGKLLGLVWGCTADTARHAVCLPTSHVRTVLRQAQCRLTPRGWICAPQVRSSQPTYRVESSQVAGPPGKDGLDGKDGKDGARGPQGPPGEVPQELVEKLARLEVQLSELREQVTKVTDVLNQPLFYPQWVDSSGTVISELRQGVRAGQTLPLLIEQVQRPAN